MVSGSSARELSAFFPKKKSILLFRGKEETVGAGDMAGVIILIFFVSFSVWFPPVAVICYYIFSICMRTRMNSVPQLILYDTGFDFRLSYFSPYFHIPYNRILEIQFDVFGQKNISIKYKARKKVKRLSLDKEILHRKDEVERFLSFMQILMDTPSRILTPEIARESGFKG